MNVNLTPDLEKIVQHKMKTGRYNSAGEVVSEALRLLEERDHRIELRREELRNQIVEGVESLRRGEGVDGEEVFDRLQRELDTLEQRKAG